MVRTIILGLLLNLILQPDSIRGQGNFKNVVIFFGDSETRPAYGRIVEGIKSSFSQNTDTYVNVFVEYMELERFSDSFHLRQVIDMYNNRVKASSIDLVITVAPGAYDTLQKYGLKILHSTPVIALEMNPTDSSRYKPDARVIEMQIQWSPQISMAHAFALFPDAKNAFIIGGCSGSDRMYTIRLEKDAEALKASHRFTILSCSSIDSIVKVVRELPDNSLVFMSSFVTDADSTPFSTGLALRIISGQSPVPVFTMSDNFIEYGGVGGNVISFSEVGKEVGHIARELLEKDTLSGITIITKSFYRFLYNWKELKKWDLLRSEAIPAGSTFFQKEYNFLEDYRWEIIGVLLLILLQTLLITYLFRLLKEQKKVAAQKIRNEQLYRELSREERLTTMALLTASLSHELNQPLTAILFNTQAGLKFLRSGRLDDQKTDAILTDIEEDVKRASGIISSVRSMMQLESREMEKIDMKDVVHDVLHILQSELKQQQIHVAFEQSNEPLMVMGDKVELQQVLINLLINAAKALKSKPPGQRHIRITSKALHDRVTISVLDNGPGIEKDMLGKLFDAFASTRVDGLGVGLTLCKAIIQRHSGEIHAENRPEGGAAFSFTLRLLNRPV